MHFDIAVSDFDIAAASGDQDVFFGHDHNLVVDGGDLDVFVAGDFNITALRLHLYLALGCNQLQGFLDCGFRACHVQADGFADVVQPSASSRLVGVALADLVEVSAGGEGGSHCLRFTDYVRLFTIRIIVRTRKIKLFLLRTSKFLAELLDLISALLGK